MRGPSLIALACAVLAGCGDDGRVPGGGDGGPHDARPDGRPLFDAPPRPDARPRIDAIPPANQFSLRLDGTGDHVRIPASGSLGGYPSLTIEAWVKLDAEQAGAIVSKRSAGAAEYELSRRADGDAQVRLAGDPVDCLAFGAAEVFVPGTWIHLAGTWGAAPTGKPRLLVNGQIVSPSACVTTNLGNALVDVLIGARDLGDGPEQFFSGHIDEVRLWNIERTAPEIAQTMSTSLIGDESGLVGYWRFEDGTGDVATDATLSGNHAQLVGDPVWSEDTPFP